MRFFKYLLLGLALLAAAQTFAASLQPGSPAPKLQIKQWLKGTPVKSFDPNKTYVVEFWATWCGPCRESIPHVSELAKKNKEITFIGVGIWEDYDKATLTKFVQEMGTKMSYNVAYSGNKDGMAETWMKAAGQNGIPTAFIVKNQKVMWIGHPMSMEEPLAKIKAGKFDLAAYKVQYAKQQADAVKQEAAMRELQAIQKQYAAGKHEEAKTALASLSQKNPDLAFNAKLIRYGWLAEEDNSAWEAQTKTMVADAEDQMVVANFVLENAGNSAKRAQVTIAADAVLAADKPGYVSLMYLQYAFVQLGEDQKALDLTNRLIAQFNDSEMKDNKALLEELTKTKQTLEAKLKKG